MGKSDFYMEYFSRMKRCCVTVTASATKRRREAEFRITTDSHKRKRTEPTSPVVVTKIRKLRDITNENVGVLGAQSILRDDASKRSRNSVFGDTHKKVGHGF